MDGLAVAVPVSVSSLGHFAALSDLRQSAKVQYLLSEIPFLVLAAAMAWVDDFIETMLVGSQHLAVHRRFYAYDSGISSHDTLSGLDPYSPEPNPVESIWDYSRQNKSCAAVWDGSSVDKVRRGV
jgi:hypothetical protein